MLVFIKWRWPLYRNEGYVSIPSAPEKMQNYKGQMKTCIGIMHAATVSVSSFLNQSCSLAVLCLFFNLFFVFSCSSFFPVCFVPYSSLFVFNLFYFYYLDACLFSKERHKRCEFGWDRCQRNLKGSAGGNHIYNILNETNKY